MDIDAGNKEPTTPVKASPLADSKYTKPVATPAPPATPAAPPASARGSAVAPDLAIALAAKEERRRELASAVRTPATSRPPAQTTGEAAAAVPGPAILKRTVSQALGPRPGDASATGSQAPRPAVSLAQLYGSSAPTSRQLGLPHARSAFSAKEADRKSEEWLSSVRARLGAAAAASATARPAAMDVEPTRSVRARRSARASASDGDVSGDDEPSDAESTGSHGEVDSRGTAGTDDAVRLLTVLCDISAFNAECLAKLAGVPMPDFDAGAEQ